MCVAELDAVGEMLEGRRHAAIHVLRIGETTQCTRLPFRGIHPLGSCKSLFMFATASSQIAFRKMEIAAEIVSLGQCLVVSERDRQRFTLGECGKYIVHPASQP